MKRVFIILLVTIFFYSCNNSVFNEYHEFTTLEWKQSEIPKFEFEITNDTTKYDIYFTLRYIEGFPFQNMIGSMLIVDENKQASLNKFKFRVVDQNREYIGDVAGNIFDIEKIIIKDTLLTKGKYKVSIEQTTATPSLAFVMDVGLIVKNAE
jgi:gliding motility-associated lipoprotein GldH